MANATQKAHHKPTSTVTMRPDAVLGGLACLVAAVGLFCATYLAVFADFGDTGFLGYGLSA